MTPPVVLKKQVRIDLHPRVLTLLDELVRTGLFGDSREDVAAQLVRGRVAELVETGVCTPLTAPDEDDANPTQGPRSEGRGPGPTTAVVLDHLRRQKGAVDCASLARHFDCPLQPIYNRLNYLEKRGDVIRLSRGKYKVRG